MPTAPHPPDQDPEEEPPVCARCSRLHYRNGRRTCTAHGTTTKMPCMAYPIPGGLVCRLHGGSLPQVIQAAEWNLRNQESRRIAAAALSTYGKGFDPPDPESIDPVGDLLILVWRSGRAERFWAERVAELEIPQLGNQTRVMTVGEGEDAQPMEVLGDATAIIGPDRNAELRLHPYVIAWNQERDRFAKICKAAVDAGIDERMTSLAEDQGALVAQLIGKIIDAIEVTPGVALSPAAKKAALEVAGRELRAIG